MPNAKDYVETQKNFLIYGATGSGKSTSLLTLPGKKFAYIFDPSGLEAFAGHDIDYETFVPDIKIKRGPLGKGSKSADMLRPDPETYLRFEEDFEQRMADDFFSQYDIVALESITTLQDMLIWYILDMQGRGNAAPEIQDYYFRTDGMTNLIRLATTRKVTLYASAHIETDKDEVSGRIATKPYLPKGLLARLPLQFSEVIPMYVDTDNNNKTTYMCNLKPTKKMEFARSSLRANKVAYDITIDFKRPLEGQGLGGLFTNLAVKTIQEVREESKATSTSTLGGVVKK